jgi:hypothetical protein
MGHLRLQPGISPSTCSLKIFRGGRRSAGIDRILKMPITDKVVPVYGALSPMQVFRVLSYQEVHQIPEQRLVLQTGERNGAASVGLRLTCVAGRRPGCRPSCSTPTKGVDVPFESMTFSGSWSSERSALDLPAWRCTDSISDTVAVPPSWKWGGGLAACRRCGGTGRSFC